VCPSLNYQPGDEELLDEYGAVVRSVKEVTLLRPAAELDSATAAAPALPIVETVSDDNFVLARDATCAVSEDTASVTTQRSIRVVKSVFDARPNSDLKSTMRCPVSLICTNWKKSMCSYPIPTTYSSVVSTVSTLA
jgi:hypothetical protein